VTNPDVGAVQLIDAATRRIIKTVEVGDGSQPFGIALAPDGSRAWITLRGAGEVVEMSLPDGAIARRWPTGPGTGPDGIAFAP
jgi:YVTN family beta-propeller protein